MCSLLQDPHCGMSPWNGWIWVDDQTDLLSGGVSC